MSSVPMPRPGLAFTALQPNVRTNASEYEAKLRLLRPVDLLAEYENVADEFYHEHSSLAWLKVVEVRREIARRLA